MHSEVDGLFPTVTLGPLVLFGPIIAGPFRGFFTDSDGQELSHNVVRCYAFMALIIVVFAPVRRLARLFH